MNDKTRPGELMELESSVSIWAQMWPMRIIKPQLFDSASFMC